MGRINTKAKHRRPVSESAAPSRGQRKRALKKASLVKKIGLTKQTVRGKDEHEDEVPNLVAVEKATPAPPCPRVEGTVARGAMTNKEKRTLMTQEMGQLAAVLKRPSFQQDPFAAVQAHLRQVECPLLPPVIDGGTKRSGKAKGSTPRIGKHSGKDRGDRKPSAKRYKGRNAKMRVK